MSSTKEPLMWGEDRWAKHVEIYGVAPYACKVRIHFHNGLRPYEDRTYTGRSVREVRRKALLRPQAETVELVETYTREEHRRVYGSGGS